MHTTTTVTALLALAATALAQSSPGCGNASPPTAGVRTMTVNGKERQYTLYVPDTYDASTPYKLIFGYHWLNGNMNSVIDGAYYGLEPLAAGSAIFVAPDGLNAGWANEGGEDLTFTDQILEEVEAELCVDQSQRYATGFSYGAAMTYAVACSRADVFTAVAVIAGAELSGCEGGNEPIPYLGIHGVADSVLAIDQGRAIRDTFLATNGCSGEESPAPNPGPSSDHVKTEYTCTNEPVVWIAHGGDHIPNPEFAPEETWNFWEPFFSTGGEAGNGTTPSTGVSSVAAVPAASSAAVSAVAPPAATTMMTSSVPPVALPSPTSAAAASIPPVSMPSPISVSLATPEPSGDADCEVVYV